MLLFNLCEGLFLEGNLIRNGRLYYQKKILLLANVCSQQLMQQNCRSL